MEHGRYKTISNSAMAMAPRRDVHAWLQDVYKNKPVIFMSYDTELCYNPQPSMNSNAAGRKGQPPKEQQD
jgi:hypothetical protein